MEVMERNRNFKGHPGPNQAEGPGVPSGSNQSLLEPKSLGVLSEKRHPLTEPGPSLQGSATLRSAL